MIRLFSVMGNFPFVMIPCLAHYACSRLSRKRKSSWPTTKSLDACRLLHLDFVMSHFNSKYEDPNLGQSPIYSPQSHQACCIIIPDVSTCWRSVENVRELHYHTLYMANPPSMALIQRAQCSMRPPCWWTLSCKQPPCSHNWSYIVIEATADKDIRLATKI